MTKKQPAKIPLSKTRIASLPIPKSGRRYWHDTRVPGFCLCITSTGSKTYYVYKWIKGRPVRTRLGTSLDLTVEQARRLASSVNVEIAGGGNPHALKLKARGEATLGELIDHWLKRAEQRKRTWLEDKRFCDGPLSVWRARPLSSIAKADVQRLHSRIGKNHPYQANRLLSLIKAMFRRADELGFEGRNPAAGVEMFREEKRDRFLQPDELAPFFVSLRDEPEVIRDAILMMLFTGARRGNVLAMQWEDVDLQRAVWRIPRTKTGDSLTIPLTAPALSILETRYENRNGESWVFPSGSRSGHLEAPKSAWARIIKRAGIKGLRVHDLRRTLGSWQAITGASLPIIGKSLGHTQPSTTAVYARLTLDPVRESTNRATAAMLSAAGLTEGEGNGTQKSS